jgi:murein DD-endopeptidase MepM/ murein hydrolase activator NlpD
MRILIKIYLIFVLGVLGLSSFSQNIIDTLTLNEFKIVLFDDQSWEYVNNDSVLHIIHYRDSIASKEYILSNKIYVPDSTTLFVKEWDSIPQLYGYGGLNYALVQDTFAIPLDSSDFTIPFPDEVISEFGWRWGRMHHALDIQLQLGEPVKAAFSGKVRRSFYNTGGYGNLVIIRHSNGLETYYAHLSKLLVTEGQWVESGEAIGLGGSTGLSYAPHLHWEVRFKDNSFNPRLMVDYENGTLKNDTLILTPDMFIHVKELSQVQYHTIVSGDSLWAISRRYGISISALCSLNSITESTILKVGQTLRVR